LDIVITGNIDFLAEIKKPITFLGNENIWCELAKVGLNSSIIIFHNVHALKCEKIYKLLDDHLDLVQKYFNRLDH